MRKNIFFIGLIITLSCCKLYSQEVFDELKKAKFGKIKPVDFNLNGTVIDSNANAIIMVKKGQSYMVRYDDGFRLIFNRFERIKIINKEGIKSSVFEIPVYYNKSVTDRITKLKGYTYQIVNNEVKTTELKSENIFEEQTSKNFRTTKVSFPNVTEGCIIDLYYETSSPYFTNIESWYFQDDYPTLYTEYTVEIPMFVQFTPFISGSSMLKYSMNYGNFNLQNPPPGLDTRTLIKTWEGFNIPALKTEPFTSSIKNYQSKISFQLASFHFPGYADETYNTSWEELTKSLIDDERFGLYNNANNWLEPIVDKIISEPNTNKEYSHAEKIFNYVRDHFLCTGNSIYTTPYASLKNIFDNKKGNVADINLLLLTMLQKAKYMAFPIVLSTTNNGIIFQQKPNLDRLNYVIVVVIENDKYKFLDASQPYNGYGLLPEYCYNGEAIIIKKDGPLKFELKPEDNIQKSNVYISLTVDSAQNWTGNIIKICNYNESISFRKEAKSKSNTLFQQYVANQISKDNSLMKVKNIKCNNIDIYEEPLEIEADLEIKKEDVDNIYINPMFGQDLNYSFTATNRQNPIEFGGLLDYTYELDIDIPAGYEVEEVPKNEKIIFDDNQIIFYYKKIAEEEKHLAIEVKLQVNTPFILANRYKDLLDFLAFINRKYKELIVLKKIK